ncbi:MAG: hypothetical protein WAV00_10740 [Nocardioides sp.]
MDKTHHPSIEVRRLVGGSALVLVTGGLGVLAAAPDAAASHPARSAGSSVTRSGSTSSVKPGAWTALGVTTQAGTPAVWQSSAGTTYLLWLLKPSGSNATYHFAKVTAGGTASAQQDAFSGAHWTGLSGTPALVGAGSAPEVIFNGSTGAGLYSHGCVYGALGPTAPWTPQPWVLSFDCVNPNAAAATDRTGTVAAAWPGGWTTGHGVNYRIGTAAYPAPEDSHVAVGTGVGVAKTGVAADAAGNDHFWVGWTETDNARAAKNGYYAEDVTAGGSPRKMPGTGTMSIAPHLGPFAELAMTARRQASGVYLAGCTNTQTCTLELWRAGSTAVHKVPSSKNAGDVAISAGPQGRIWVAWYDASTNKVKVTRTNRGASRFGRVLTFSTPCFEGGLLGLTSGTSSRVVIGMQCLNKKSKTEEYVTRTTAALTLGASAHKVSKGTTITFTVTDAGDAVAGAKVSFEGHTATTNSVGRAKLKATAKGTATVKATKSGYVAATTRIKVT